MRINAYLARAGVASRRGADELIKSGRVTVDDTPANLNTDVDENSRVFLDGRPVKINKLTYILLNKPAGYITTMKDPEGRRTVIELVSTNERVVPVGRLDYDTTGVLLLTNDGQLAHKLMHPSFEVDKVYLATVEGEISEEKLKKLSTGIELEDGRTAPAAAKKVGSDQVELAVHEGRKHQVKRMLAAVGLPVVSLHRTSYAGLRVDGLMPGDWRYLNDEEVSELLKMVQ